MSRRTLLVIATLVVLIGAGVGIVAAVDAGGGKPRSTSPTNEAYAELWQGTHLGDGKGGVLARWPKVPYQHYADNLKDDCYEWADHPSGVYKHLPAHLYNLCFKNGVLRSKVLF